MDPTAVAVDTIFQVVPGNALPPGPPVVIIEIDGAPRWLIREGAPMPDVIDEMNRLGTHLVRHGLWEAHRMRNAG